MAQYRKKPVVVEAVTISEFRDAFIASQWQGIPSWVKEASDSGQVRLSQGGVVIKTLEGTMRGEPDDWIIRGVQGEIYPCKPDIFAATYDPVKGPNDPTGYGPNHPEWERPRRR